MENKIDIVTFSPEKGGLSNQQLYQLLAYDPYFIGVFPRNRLPMSAIVCRQLPLTLIVNTDTANLPGRHWVAIYVDEQRRGEYFDSLSQPIPKHMLLWLSCFTNQWKYVLRPFIDPPIQNIYSLTCGAFAFYFVHQRPLFNFSHEVLWPFLSSSSLIDNDRFVISFTLKK